MEEHRIIFTVQYSIVYNEGSAICCICKIKIQLEENSKQKLAIFIANVLFYEENFTFIIRNFHFYIRMWGPVSWDRRILECWGQHPPGSHRGSTCSTLYKFMFVDVLKMCMKISGIEPATLVWTCCSTIKISKWFVVSGLKKKKKSFWKHCLVSYSLQYLFSRFITYLNNITLFLYIVQ